MSPTQKSTITPSPDTSDSNTQPDAQRQEAEQEPFALGTLGSENELSQAVKAQIETEIRNTHAAVEREKTRFSRRLRAWLANQFDRVGNAVVALLIAVVAAAVMPFLVKLQMSDDIGVITESLGDLAQQQPVTEIFQNTQRVAQQTEAVNEQNSEILAQLGALSSQVTQVTDSSNTDSLQESIQQLQQQTEQQALSLQQILRSLNDLQPQSNVASVALNYEQLATELARLIRAGTALQSQADNDVAIRSWVEQSYLLTSLVQLKDADATVVRAQMRAIYLQQKPFDESEAQLMSTLHTLNTLQVWVNLYE